MSTSVFRLIARLALWGLVGSASSQGAETEKYGPTAALAFARSYRGEVYKPGELNCYPDAVGVPFADCENIIPMTANLWTPRQLSADFRRRMEALPPAERRKGIIVLLKTERCAPKVQRLCTTTTAALEKRATPLAAEFLIYGVLLKSRDRDNPPGTLKIETGLDAWKNDAAGEYLFKQGPGATLAFVDPTNGSMFDHTNAELLHLTEARFQEGKGRVPELHEKLDEILVHLRRRMLPLANAGAAGTEAGMIEKSGAWEQIRDGEYLVENNTWNIASAGEQPWKQSVFCDPATGARGWRWDFTGHNAVSKTYPQLIYGKKPYAGYASTTPRLPTPFATARFRLEYDYVAKATGAYNTTTDITFTDRAAAGEKDIRAKLMIWFDHQNLPFHPDRKLRRAVIAGRGHQVLIDPNHDGADGKWTFIALLPDDLPARGELDLTAYFAWLLQEGALQPGWFLASIETGSEIASGAGEVRFRRFVVR